MTALEPAWSPAFSDPASGLGGEAAIAYLEGMAGGLEPIPAVPDPGDVSRSGYLFKFGYIFPPDRMLISALTKNTRLAMTVSAVTPTRA